MSRLAVSWLLLAGVVSAQTPAPPQWSAVPRLCARLASAGWRNIDPLGSGRPATGPVTVGGSVGITLCRATRNLPAARGTTAPRLELFMQFRGGDNLSMSGELWDAGDRQALLTAMNREFAAVAAQLSLTIPAEMRDAIQAADSWSDDADGLTREVSIETRAEALVSQPDLKPNEVPLLKVDATIAVAP